MEKKEFDLASLDAADEARMEVVAGNKGTGWFMIFAGPGDPRGIAQQARIARERLADERAQSQAVVNGRKWKAPHRTPDEVRQSNIDFVMERLVGWTAVKFDGQDFPYSEENARRLLGDPRKGVVLQQCVEFILDDNSFTTRSPKV